MHLEGSSTGPKAFLGHPVDTLNPGADKTLKVEAAPETAVNRERAMPRPYGGMYNETQI